MSSVLTFLTTIRGKGDEPTILISSPDQDRDGDTIDQFGAVLENYRKNPVVLFAHDYSSLPVGGATRVQLTEEGILASWRWVEGDAFADRVRNCFDQGILRAASIGFRPLKSEPRGTGTHYLLWELLEFSLVPVPANPAAVRVLRSAGLWTPALAKAGRALSAVNEDHLRQALDHVTGCSDHLTQVLAALEPDDLIDIDMGDDGDLNEIDIDPAVVAASFQKAAKTISADVKSFVATTIAREVTRTVNRRLGRLDDDDPLPLDRVRAHHISGDGDIDPATVRAAVADVMLPMMRQTLGEIKRELPETIATAVRRSRGRLD